MALIIKKERRVQDARVGVAHMCTPLVATHGGVFSILPVDGIYIDNCMCCQRAIPPRFERQLHVHQQCWQMLCRHLPHLAAQMCQPQGILCATLPGSVKLQEILPQATASESLRMLTSNAGMHPSEVGQEPETWECMQQALTGCLYVYSDLTRVLPCGSDADTMEQNQHALWCKESGTLVYSSINGMQRNDRP